MYTLFNRLCIRTHKVLEGHSLQLEHIGVSKYVKNKTFHWKSKLFIRVAYKFKFGKWSLTKLKNPNIEMIKKFRLVL